MAASPRAMNFYDDGDDDRNNDDIEPAPIDPGDETYVDPLVGEGDAVDNSQL